MKKIKKLLLPSYVVMSTFFLNTTTLFADVEGAKQTGTNFITQMTLLLGVSIALCLIIFVAFPMMTSGGDEAKRKKAISAFGFICIAAVIGVGAVAIASWIMNQVAF